MIGIIAAVSSNGVIGVGNSLPFSYKKDMEHFRKTTADSTVIMGRKTFESLNCKPLPKRRNIIITSSKINQNEVESFSSMKEAISSCEGSTWIIGGHKIYQDGMQFADKIVLTITPDIIEGKEVIKFPWINPLIYKIENSFTRELDKENKLTIVEYYRYYKI